MNRRKPEHLMPYFSINRLQVLHISHWNTSQVNIAELDVEHCVWNKEDFLFDEMQGVSACQ